MTRKVLAVDWEKCTGCRACEVACALEKEGWCAPGYARLRVIRNEATGVDLPLVCQHCTDPPCFAACPTGALRPDGDGGIVLLKLEECIGCGLCTKACPVGAIFFDPEGQKVRKCDLCGGDPQCIEFCEPGAIQLVDRNLVYLAKGEKIAWIHSGIRGAGEGR